MTLQKTAWSATGNDLSLSVPFTKVDSENRTVSGFATLDNKDRQGDVVTTEASIEAFANSRRNLREMHQPIAAGKVLDYSVEKFYDAKTDTNYEGIFVTARVSKGAQDTWEKVLDGTLTGFSIGGKITKAEPKFDKALGENIQIIKAYELTELSLVDNPANQLANIFSVQKSADGTDFVKGVAMVTKGENVFWCPKDEVAKSSEMDSLHCSSCTGPMENIGWFETTANKDADMRSVVTKFLSSKQSEGGVNTMDTNLTKNSASTTEGGEATNEAVPGQETQQTQAEILNEDNAAETEPAGEESVVETEPVNSDEPDFGKMFSDLSGEVQKSIEKSQEATTEAVSKVESQIEEFKKTYDEKFTELKSQFDEFSKSIDGYRTSSDEVAKRLDALEEGTAIKKSGDVEVTREETSGADEPLFKGAFLGLGGLTK